MSLISLRGLNLDCAGQDFWAVHPSHSLSYQTCDLYADSIRSPVFVVATVLFVSSPPALTLAQVCDILSELLNLELTFNVIPFAHARCSE